VAGKLVSHHHQSQWLVAWNTHTVIAEVDWVMGSRYCYGRPQCRKGVSSDHKCDTGSLFPNFWVKKPASDIADSKSLGPYGTPANLSYPLALILQSGSQICTLSQIHFGCYVRCNTDLMMQSWLSNSVISPHYTSTSHLYDTKVYH